ncbi:hypothetical protein POVWA2_033080 [Plasmodium ovale wallikeri]|uniref:Uncharacterized protein n=1 Tax=Plasmodium ovale wallikeri TaxID=864142 RepID=A0A1A8YZZ0_PLAOA|nr:hypothetical protein POVWA1_033460 [Plasmodium ovale wallikeri]SBT37089.1 hypothetical protein POVWA2_033080 [Plasmodium ovale wallikeri]
MQRCPVRGRRSFLIAVFSSSIRFLKYLEKGPTPLSPPKHAHTFSELPSGQVQLLLSHYYLHNSFLHYIRILKDFSSLSLQTGLLYAQGMHTYAHGYVPNPHIYPPRHLRMPDQCVYKYFLNIAESPQFLAINIKAKKKNATSMS